MDKILSSPANSKQNQIPPPEPDGWRTHPKQPFSTWKRSDGGNWETYCEVYPERAAAIVAGNPGQGSLSIAKPFDETPPFKPSGPFGKLPETPENRLQPPGQGDDPQNPPVEPSPAPGEPVAADYVDEDNVTEELRAAAEERERKQVKKMAKAPGPDAMASLREKIEELEERKSTPPELPPPFGPLVNDVARITGVPPGPVSLVALATASAALGKGWNLDNPPYKTAPNLYALAAAESGTGKSQLFRFVTAPLAKAQAEAKRNWEARDLPKATARLQSLEVQEKRLKRNLAKNLTTEARGEVENSLSDIARDKAESEKDVHPPRLMAEDVTIEQLSVLLARNNENLAVISSESGNVLANLFGRHTRKGQAGATTGETLFLKGYSQDPHTVDRVTAPAVHLDAPCLTTCLTVTPDHLQDLFGSPRFLEGGLLARFLFSHETWSPSPDTGEILSPSHEAHEAWNKALAEQIAKKDGAGSDVEVSKDAAEDFRTLHNQTVLHRFNSEPALRAFNNRLVEQAKRLALILHAYTRPTFAPLDGPTAQLGIDLANYFTHAPREMLEGANQAKDETDIERIAEIAKKYGRLGTEGEGPWNTITLRNLKRSGFTEERVRFLAVRFPQQLKIEAAPIGAKGGRRSIVVKVLAHGP